MGTRQGPSNEYPHHMFLSRNKTNINTPKPPDNIIVKTQSKKGYGYLFVCVEVLRPSQTNGVISSAVILPYHTIIGQV